jgi:hypothetical protein
MTTPLDGCNSKDNILSPHATEELGGANLKVALAIDIRGNITSFVPEGGEGKPVRFPILNVKNILNISGLQVVARQSSPTKITICWPNGSGGMECRDY